MAETKKFSVEIREEKYVNLINNTLGDPTTAKRFVAEISSVVANNYQLQKCTTSSLVSGALLAQALNLPLSQSLGFAYLVPYKNADGYTLAQFQIGWKGFVQLALRTGQYETIGVKLVHFGEVAGQDEFGDDIIKFNHKYDNEKVVGVFAYFKLLNGFKKTLYWTVEQCEKHGETYSKAHRGKNKGSDNDNWAKMFDAMACKTVLKQLISKYGVMSVDLQKAIETDQATVDGDKVNYVDSTTTHDEDISGEVVDVEEIKTTEPKTENEMSAEEFLAGIGYESK